MIANSMQDHILEIQLGNLWHVCEVGMSLSLLNNLICAIYTAWIITIVLILFIPASKINYSNNLATSLCICLVYVH